MIKAVIHIVFKNKSQITFGIQIKSLKGDTIESNGKYDVYCTGSMTCRDIAITNALNVCCTGNYACFGATVSNIKGNACSYTERSSYYINFIAITANIYCIELLPCWTGSMTNVNGSVFAFSGIIPSDNQVSNINDQIIVAEWYELEGSAIRNVKNIHATESGVIRSTKIVSEADIKEIFVFTISADMDAVHMSWCSTRVNNIECCYRGDKVGMLYVY